MFRRTTVLLTVLISAGSFLALAAPAEASAPTITSFTPTSGVLGGSVTITGTGFTAPATVTIGGGASGTVTVSSSTRIVASVGGEAATGHISIRDGGGTVTSTGTFTVRPGVLLASTAGPPGSAVSVRASGLAAGEAADVYVDTTDVALVTTDTQGALSRSVTLSAAITPGVHWISVVGRRSGSAAQASFTVRTDSPQFGGSATHQSYYVHENVLNASTVDALTQVWTGGESAFNTPAIVGGVVYGTPDNNVLYALDEATGAQRWQHLLTGDSFTSSPAVANGLVYMGTSAGYVYAFSATTGSLRWSAHPSTSALYTAPAVSGSLVYVASQDGTLTALSTTTGAQAWQYPAAGPVNCSPAVSAGLVFSCSNDDKVFALYVSTGTPRWIATTTFAGQRLAVADGSVFVDDGANIYALSTSNGGQRWAVNVGNAGTIAVAGGRVYHATGEGQVQALNEATGATVWTTAVGSATDGVTGLTYANGVVYDSTYEDTYLLSSAGAVVDTLPAGSYGLPIVVDGTVTLADPAAGVERYALDGSVGAAPGRPAIASLRRTR